MTRSARSMLVGLVVLLLAGSLASAAYAEAGPFFHQRLKGEKGSGVKIAEKSPENFSGSGGEQILKTSIVGEPIEIVTKGQQVKGVIYNTALQGQAKVLMVFKEPRLVKPALSKCEVKIGESNQTKFRVYLTWKWDGTKEQLVNKNPGSVQAFDGTVIDSEIAAGAKEFPKGLFTTVKLTNCGVLGGSFAVRGSATAPKFVPSKLEEWSRELNLTYGEGKLKQHFWNGGEFIGGETGLFFGESSADLTGTGSLGAEKQEVAVFER